MPCSRSPGRGWYPSMPCRFPGPHPRGKLRGLAGGGLQAHTQGVSSPTPEGVSRPTPGRVPALGGVSRPTPGGACLGVPAPGGSARGGGLWKPPNGYCCERYASYWNAFLLQEVL